MGMGGTRTRARRALDMGVGGLRATRVKGGGCRGLGGQTWVVWPMHGACKTTTLMVLH